MPQPAMVGQWQMFFLCAIIFTCVLPGKNPGVWQANQKKKVKVMVSCDGVIFSIAFTLCSQCPLQNDKLTQQKSRLLYD